jgi:hypothetical protein
VLLENVVTQSTSRALHVQVANSTSFTSSLSVISFRYFLEKCLEDLKTHILFFVIGRYYVLEVARKRNIVFECILHVLNNLLK